MRRMTTARAGDGRNWPQSIRITRRERQLLREAATDQGASIAKILRQELDPLFSRLARRSRKAA